MGERAEACHLKFTPTAIPDVILIETDVYEDERGYFIEAYQPEKYRQAGIGGDFVQDNLAGSKCGTLRGLHYQLRKAQGKLIQIVAGEVFDVAVDLRASSSTFGRAVSTRLSSQEKKQLWVPPGFAHGYYVLSEWAVMAYKVTDVYDPASERSLLWSDPQLNIDWPLIADQPLLISSKDAAGVKLEDAEVYTSL